MKVRASFLPLPTSRQEGFTLIELLMVSAIIAVLMTIGVKAFTENRMRTYDTQVISVMRSLLTAAETNPPTMEEVLQGELASENYPEITLNRGMKLNIDEDAANDGMWRFYMGHQGGELGFYFWVPDRTCNVDGDPGNPTPSGDPLPSDKIVPTFATAGDYNWVQFRTNANL
jgi:type IV pilus assembly protein PilA